MGVDKTRHDDAVPRVYDVGIHTGREVLADGCDEISLDEHVRVRQVAERRVERENVPALDERGPVAEKLSANHRANILARRNVVGADRPLDRRCHVRRLVGIWSKFQQLDRRPIIQDERDPHPG